MSNQQLVSTTGIFLSGKRERGGERERGGQGGGQQAGVFKNRLSLGEIDR
jgi:hypothetical protein